MGIVLANGIIGNECELRPYMCLHDLAYLASYVPTVAMGGLILHSHLSPDKTSTADLGPVFNLDLSPMDPS